jgi:hypothetical protein
MKLRAPERQTRINAIAQLPEKRKQEWRFPHFVAVPPLAA